MERKVIKTEEIKISINDIELSDLIKENFERLNPGFKTSRIELEIRQGLVDNVSLSLRKSKEFKE